MKSILLPLRKTRNDPSFEETGLQRLDEKIGGVVGRKGNIFIHNRTLRSHIHNISNIRSSLNWIIRSKLWIACVALWCVPRCQRFANEVRTAARHAL